jgi:hypothetical protein
MRLTFAYVVIFSLASFAQNVTPKPTPVAQAPTYRLELLDTVISESELAGIWGSPLRCDADGNIYFGAGEDMFVRKIDRKGKKVAEFRAVTQPDFQVQAVGYYFVGLDGEVFQVTFKENSPDRYVFEYRADGTLKSKFKLDAGFPWTPNQLTVFPSGIILASGQSLRSRTKPAARPFTGLFTADGRLLREVSLSEDQSVMKMAEGGDAQIISSDNRAISGGDIEVAGDGNAYLMRRVNPAIVYVISPAGEVLRRFIVKSEKDRVLPSSLHASKSRIAILFWNNDTKEMEIKVMDLDGNQVARYENSSDGQLPKAGTAFSCFSENPDRFTFMTAVTGDKLALRTFGVK